MLANVPNTQVHRHSCTFFSHVPCYMREHTVEEHHRTHSLTHIRTCSRTYTRKKQKTKNKKQKTKNKKLTHSCIVGDKIAHLYIQMSFPHFIHIPTFYPQSFPHFWGSYPHFSGTFPHVFHIFWRVFHIFLEFPTFYKHSHMCIYS